MYAVYGFVKSCKKSQFYIIQFHGNRDFERLIHETDL